MKEFMYQRFWLRVFVSLPIALAAAVIVGVLLYFLAPAVPGYSLPAICIILTVMFAFLSFPLCGKLFYKKGQYKYQDGVLRICMGKQELNVNINDIVGIECGEVKMYGERYAGLFIRTKDNPKKIFKIISPKIKSKKFNISDHEYMYVLKKVVNNNRSLKEIKDNKIKNRVIYVTK